MNFSGNNFVLSKNEKDFNDTSENPIIEDLRSEYILGVGDKLVIEFVGVEIFSREYTINPEGEIFMPEIKNINVSGMTLKELKKELTKKYQSFIFDPEINIIISKYRPVFVYLKGEFKKPGLYKLEKSEINKDENFFYEKLYDAIKKAGGVNNEADLSNIIVIRNNSISQGGGKISAKLNLLKLITEGDQSSNIRLLDQDTIIIPKSTKNIKEQVIEINKSNLNPDQIKVFISGNVNSVGEIILGKGSNLVQAIAASGGKKIMSGNIEFIRFKKNGKTDKRIFRFNPNSKIGSKENPILMEGDIINVRKTFLGNTTEILNEVSNPFISGYGLIKLFD